MNGIRRTSKILLGLLLLYMGGTAFVDGSWLMLLLAILGLLALGGRLGRATAAAEARSVAPARSDQRPSVEAQVHRHAIRAQEAAGIDPDDSDILVTDIGLLAYFADKTEPVAYRNDALPGDADSIQPWVHLCMSTAARGTLGFEIRDEHDELLFNREQHEELQRGDNFINPPARLPLRDMILPEGAHWRMDIRADGRPLARHEFRWAPAAAASIRHDLDADGEMSADLSRLAREKASGEQSLDELLSDG